MQFKAKIKAVHDGEPVEADISVEFGPQEYIEIIKVVPKALKQIRKQYRAEVIRND